MPSLAAIGVKLLISLVIVILQKSGLEGKIVATGLKAGEHLQTALANVKTYQQYPTGKNGA